MMATASDHAAYFEHLSRRSWGAWLVSAVAAAGLTLGLFFLMPFLTDPSPVAENPPALVSRINVIRVKRPDTRVEKKKPVKLPEPKKVKVINRPVAPVKRPVNIARKMSLPFEINPRLPAGPDALQFPVLEAGPVMAPAGVPDFFDTGDLDAPLTVLARVPPIYPVRARRRGIQGWVQVFFTVNRAGHVEDIEILKADPKGFFEESVERCVAGWRFSPPTVGGCR